MKRGMPDREKVIKGLEIHIKPNSRCVGCPYPNNGLCGDQLYMDALTLLKEQEESIPVSWLKEKLDGHPELPCAVIEGIIDILDLWTCEKIG